MSETHRRYVVVGGGIAGVTCAQELRRLDPAHQIVLVSADSTLKGVSTVKQISKTVQELEVVDQPATTFAGANLEVVEAEVLSVDLRGKSVKLSTGTTYTYDKLCLCTGARPKEISGSNSPRVKVLRDRDTVTELAEQLACSRKILVVGNGGIALQLVSSLHEVEIVWAVKHGHIGDAFFDLDAAAFLLRELQYERTQQQSQSQSTAEVKPPLQEEAAPAAVRQAEHGESVGELGGLQPQQQQGRYAGVTVPQLNGTASGPCPGHHAPSVGQEGSDCSSRDVDHRNLKNVGKAGQQSSSEGSVAKSQHSSACDVQGWKEVQPLQGRSRIAKATFGRGVGPEWAAQLVKARGSGAGPLTLELHCTLAAVEDRGGEAGSCPVRVTLSNGHVHDVDCVICGIGVEPDTDWLPAQLERSPADGGVLVDLCMQSSVEDVYAAGDVCSVRESALPPDWFQMRLWTQARLMGMRASQSMAGAEDSMGFSLELFTHVTRFCGKKVVLLGLYNGQCLENEPEEDLVSYCRESEEPGPDSTFVRVLLLRGRLRGAVLIGETELEDTFENLILDGLDLSPFGPALLDPNIELDHVFD